MPCPLMQTENKPIQAEATPPAGTGLRVQYRRNDLVFSGYRPPWWSRDGMEDPEHSLGRPGILSGLVNSHLPFLLFGLEGGQIELRVDAIFRGCGWDCNCGCRGAICSRRFTACRLPGSRRENQGIYKVSSTRALTRLH